MGRLSPSPCLLRVSPRLFSWTLDERLSSSKSNSMTPSMISKSNIPTHSVLSFCVILNLRFPTFQLFSMSLHLTVYEPHALYISKISLDFARLCFAVVVSLFFFFFFFLTSPATSGFFLTFSYFFGSLAMLRLYPPRFKPHSCPTQPLAYAILLLRCCANEDLVCILQLDALLLYRCILKEAMPCELWICHAGDIRIRTNQYQILLSRLAFQANCTSLSVLSTELPQKYRSCTCIHSSVCVRLSTRHSARFCTIYNFVKKSALNWV